MRKIYIDYVNLTAFIILGIAMPFLIFMLNGEKYNVNAVNIIISEKMLYVFLYLLFVYVCFSFVRFKQPKTGESLFIIIAFGGLFFTFSFLTILFQSDSVVREYVTTKNEHQLKEWLKTDRVEHTLIVNGWDATIVEYVDDGYVIEAGFLYKKFLVDKENFEQNVTCNFENYKILIDKNSIPRTTCAFPIYKMIVDIST